MSSPAALANTNWESDEEVPSSKFAAVTEKTATTNSAMLAAVQRRNSQRTGRREVVLPSFLEGEEEEEEEDGDLEDLKTGSSNTPDKLGSAVPLKALRAVPLKALRAVPLKATALPTSIGAARDNKGLMRRGSAILVSAVQRDRVWGCGGASSPAEPWCCNSDRRHRRLRNSTPTRTRRSACVGSA